MRRTALASALLVPVSLLGALAGAPRPALADAITRGAVTLDATDPVRPRLTTGVTWTAEGGPPRSALTFWLAPGVQVDAASADGRALAVESGEADASGLVPWTVRLPIPLPAGESRTFELRSTVRETGRPGQRVDETGGWLLPGTGWFPRVERETDELLACSVEFVLPSGWTGVAGGRPTAPGGPWATRPAIRPFAVWGTFERVDVPGEPGFVAYRRPGRTGQPPALDRLRALLEPLTAGVGPAVGEGPWMLVDVGEGIVRGGARTVFWDEEEVAELSSGRATAQLDRDLGGALAASFWSEWMRFRGDLAAWMEGGIARSLGDFAAIAIDPDEVRLDRERLVIGARRAQFLESRAGDRPLAGLVAGSPGESGLLDGRGALVAHLLARAASSRSLWMLFLHDFRAGHDGSVVDWPLLRSAAAERFPNQLNDLPPFLESLALPDFRITAHGPDQSTGKARYRVEIENVGDATTPLDVAAFTPGGQLLRSLQIIVKPGMKRAVLFRDSERLGRIELDPTGVVPQPSVEDERVVLAAAPDEPEEAIVPSYRFSTKHADCARLTAFALELAPGLTISGFDGYIEWWQTHHGPSGASLMGRGVLTIAPPGPFGESLRAALGSDTLEFEADEMWIRFPLAKWAEIEPLLGERVNALHEDNLVERNRRIHQFSFTTYFHDEMRARVPAPGAALVTFGLGTDERRGFVIQPLPDGKTMMRLWDHRRGTTIWEATL